MNALILMLNDFAAKIAKRAELLAAALVIAIVLMLVLPMPIWLLDMLIAVNLFVAALMVVVAMYMPGPTAFSTFPAVLLLTTLFRLALEVSTSRLILLEADAGHIVETFGNFVVGGNLVVGLVVFLILTVVQFIVITKGSERVSEVAARFTLDAMPGKQMSIDNDLRNGSLSADDAKRKRAELAKESQMHGAMDGAMKFVKGDSIAGIFIVAVNLIGGISIGVIQKGMAAGDAMQLYSVLTIGDALIAQIPGLLISLTAGMITTRIADEEEKHDEDGEEVKTNIGQDIVAELFGEPKALSTVSVVMLLFGLIPGMPLPVFATLAVGAAVAGIVGLKSPKLVQAMAQAAEAAASPRVADAYNFSATKPFMVRMPLALRDTPADNKICDALRLMRNRVLQHHGIPDVPFIEFEYVPSIPEGTIRFLMAEVPLIEVQIRTGWGVTYETAERLTELGFNAEEDGLAGTRRRRVWVELDKPEQLAEAGVSYETWEDVFASDVRVELMRNCQMFLGAQEANRFFNWAERRVPALGKELTKAVTPPRLAEILQRLAREGVSLRNVRLILETVLEWSQKERDPDVVAEYVRLALKRQLCHEVSRDGLIEAVLLSPETEDQLRSAVRQTSQGTYLDLDPEMEQAILNNLGELLGTGVGVFPILVTAADIRRSVRKLIEEEFFSVQVFAFSELTQHARVQPVGMVEI
jgi:type III secretion protein V